MARACWPLLFHLAWGEQIMFYCDKAAQEQTTCDKRVSACHGRTSSLLSCSFEVFPAGEYQLHYTGVSFQAVDWDGDGDIDLLGATLEGSIVLYDRVASEDPFHALVSPSNETNNFDRLVASIKLPEANLETLEHTVGWIGPKFHAIDWDGDGDLDLLAIDPNHTLTLWEQVEGELFQDSSPFQNLTDICAVQAVDWEGDGDLDLVLGRCNGNLLLVERLAEYLHPQEGVEDPFQGVHVTSYGSIQAIDWDGDSDIDLFVSGSYALAFFERLSSGALVMRSDGGNPLSLQDLRVVSSGSLQLIDWNHDGELDVLFSTSSSSCSTTYCLALYLRTPPSTWLLREQFSNPFASVRAPDIDYSYAIDWDLDGDVDILMHKKSGLLSWFERVQGTGLLEHQLRGGELQHITCLQAVDVDHDGRLEILMCKPPGQLVVFKETEPGKLVPQAGHLNPFQSLQLTCATHSLDSRQGWQAAHVQDINSDGFLDVLDCGCRKCQPQLGESGSACGPGNVTLHLGTAEGFRSFATAFAGKPGLCQIVDFDSDGALDLLVGASHAGIDSELLMLQLGPPMRSRLIKFSLSERYPETMQFVDWNNAGQLDILAKGPASVSMDEIWLYTRGFCELPTACNGVGRCTSDGTCDCPAANSGLDCSICASGYWGRNLPLYSSECFPCPGSGTESGTCSERGVCNDDPLAQARATGSRLSITTARGDGNCSCSEGFGGVDTMGMTTCSEGECPVGFELRLGAGTVKTCQPCLPGYGKAFPGNGRCAQCEGNEYAGSEDGGVCRSCGVAHVADQNHVSCSIDISFALLASGFFLAVCFMALMLPALLGLRLFVQDIAHQEGKGIVVTTASWHFLLKRCCFVKVQFADTGIPWLDQVEDAYCVLPVSHRQLWLRSCSEKPVPIPTDALCGHLWLRFPDSFFAVGVIQIPFIVLFACCAGTVFAIVTLLPPTSMNLVPVIAAAATVLGLSGTAYRFASRRRTPLSHALGQFRKLLSEQHPHPSSCEHGPQRAINMSQLTGFFEHFQGFIRERNMHYVCKNMLLPLTRRHRLSYAELVGPCEVQWFVSHYWGTPFRHFVQSLRKHSESGVVSGAWQAQKYWICSFSNNQWQLENELGNGRGWEYCSFYLALQSGDCVGTTMVFDDDAMPLERSWCLFELLQTFLLSQRPQFQGLFLCTPSGVLNTGMCSIDAALGIVQKLSDLRLQDAQASLKEDKQMIDRLVRQQGGGFDAVNRVLKSKIYDILAIMQSRSSAEMDELQRKLKASITGQVAPNLTGVSANNGLPVLLGSSSVAPDVGKAAAPSTS